MRPANPRFATLHHARRVWAIGAVLGDPSSLSRLHGWLETRIWRGDRLVYLGNLLGHGPDVAGTIQEMLLFRRAVLSRPGFEPEDIVLLRGAQEEMFRRLLEIQWAPGPAAAAQTLTWMADQGAAATVSAYGGSIAEGIRVARQGPVQLARWTNGLREAVRARPGHDPLLAGIKRAAVTQPVDLAGPAPGVLFVSAGIDPDRPPEAQGDAFWWNPTGFDRAVRSDLAADGTVPQWGGFARIVRGWDPESRGVQSLGFGLSLDARPNLAAAALSPDGTLLDLIEV